MKTIDQLKDALQKEQTMIKTKLAVLNALPANVVPERITTTASNADAWMHFSGTRSSLPELYKALPGLPAVKVKDSCTWFQPLERLREKDHDNAVHVAPYTFKVDKVADYPATAKAEWWTKLADLVVKITVELKGDRATYTQKQIRDHAGRLIDTIWTLSNIPTGNKITWWAEAKQAKPITIFWYDSETETIEDVIY